MPPIVNRIAFSTSVPSAARERAFDDAARIVSEWLMQQASEFGLTWSSTSQGQVISERAKLWCRRDDDSLLFAFSHKDERTTAVEWHVLAGISRSDDRAHLEVEVRAEGAGSLTPPLDVPAFLPKIVEEVGLVDVWPLTSDAQRITPENAPAFTDLLTDARRSLPIVAFSQPVPLTNEDVARIARRLAGAAHIVLVTVAASFSISDRIGRELSVYQGAVRVYPPKLPRSPYAIKLYFPATIQRYNEQPQHNGVFGSTRFADVLVRSALDRRMWPAPDPEIEPPAKIDVVAQEAPVDREGTEVEAPARPVERPHVQEAPPAEVSPTLSAIALEVKKSATIVEPPQEIPSELATRAAELEAEVEELRERSGRLQTALDNANDSWYNAQTQLEEMQKRTESLEEMTILGGRSDSLTEEDSATLRSLLDAFLWIKRMAERAAAAENVAQQLRDENDVQRREIGKLTLIRDRLLQADDSAPIAPSKPKDYRNIGELEAYLEAKHGACIRLHPNARETLAKGLYEDSNRIIEMLDLLGRPHSTMKAGHNGSTSYQAFNAQKEGIHVKYGPALSATSLGEYGHHYEVTDEHGRRISAREIGHIRDLGTTYAPERMAAIYFYWDPESSTTVITSGPRKLPTAADGT